MSLRKVHTINRQLSRIRVRLATFAKSLHNLPSYRIRLRSKSCLFMTPGKDAVLRRRYVNRSLGFLLLNMALDSIALCPCNMQEWPVIRDILRWMFIIRLLLCLEAFDILVCASNAGGFGALLGLGYLIALLLNKTRKDGCILGMIACSPYIIVRVLK